MKTLSALGTSILETSIDCFPSDASRLSSVDAAARILQVVQAIPAGSVMSYGAVALRAGFPRGARRAARALAASCGSTRWHRVVKSDGRIAFPPGSSEYKEQERRLLREGVEVRNGRVKLPKLEEDLDAAMWGPGRRSADHEPKPDEPKPNKSLA